MKKLLWVLLCQAVILNMHTVNVHILGKLLTVHWTDDLSEPQLAVTDVPVSAMQFNWV